MSSPVLDPVYSETYYDLLIDPDTYGEETGGGQSFNRTASDSVATLTDSVARVATYTRTAGDSVSSITESVSGINVLPRTVADSLSSATEAVTRVATNARTLADSLSSISDSVSRVLSLARTAADSLSSITEAVVQVRTYGRTVADSIAALTESISRGSATETKIFVATNRGFVSTLTSRDNGANNYATARNGTGVLEIGGGHIAQQKLDGFPQYHVLEGFMDFDTSSIPANAVIDSARLDAYGGETGVLYGTTAPAQNLEFHKGSFSLPITTASWVPGGSIASDTLLGTTPHTSFQAVQTPFSVTLDTSGVTQAGSTKIYTSCERTRTNNAPTTGSTNFETMDVWSTKGSQDTFGNNKLAPRLTVTYTTQTKFNRTASASLATLTEAVASVKTLSRSLADSISSITEFVIGEVNGLFTRTASDSISSMTEAVTRSVSTSRTVSDSISSTTEAVVAVVTSGGDEQPPQIIFII